MAHINYHLNNDKKDSEFVDDWIDDLKAELATDEPVTLTFSHNAVKEMILNNLSRQDS